MRSSGFSAELGRCVAILVLSGGVTAAAEPTDGWISTKAKITLLTSDDVGAAGIGVETRNGVVTLHGKVDTASEKAKAEALVRKVSGVRDVWNQLEVVPRSRKDLVKEADDAIKGRLKQCFERDRSLEGVRVTSVNDGVVLLSGEVDSPQDELRAIEAVHACTSVRRVASDIRTRQQ